jgi:hypothetical protein
LPDQSAPDYGTRRGASGYHVAARAEMRCAAADSIGRSRVPSAQEKQRHPEQEGEDYRRQPSHLRYAAISPVPPRLIGVGLHAHHSITGTGAETRAAEKTVECEAPVDCHIRGAGLR